MGIYFKYKTAKTRQYEQIMENMQDKSSEYKFNHKWKFYDGYVGANFDRSTSLNDYRKNLHQAFRRVNKFKKLTAKQQKEILENPYSGGNYHITFDLGYIQFYNDTHKNK